MADFLNFIAFGFYGPLVSGQSTNSMISSSALEHSLMDYYQKTPWS